MAMNEMSPTGLHRRVLWKKVLIATLLGSGFALALEPDHTAGLPVLVAFALWSTHILFAAALFLAILETLRFFGAGNTVATVLSVLLVPFLFAPLSLLLDYGFGKPDEELQSAMNPVAVYLSEVVAVAPVALAVAVAAALIFYRETPDREPETVAAAPSLKSLIASVPAALGNDIVRMHAQDHYVEIVTAKGSALLTEQFGDCVDKLGQLDGLQCHRSHWVSLAHVTDVVRSGSAYKCTMSNGDAVPVSRRRYSELRERMARATASSTE
ncbi:LytTR family DNA-binding domain-containing protein [Nitratireductor sp. XY-223]|uniref:LytTR family DNA-binding domain-containing protein n=1 Tax=Nitratireductor sp. XY-223 TaxID=2561926 RepID=UPI0010AB4AF7|nr:LytTR family DNA-binding domain-containing protein [Nitratireductor sp. XY-223]